MKKNVLFAVLMVLSTVSIYAFSPLNETFENFATSATPLTSVLSTTGGFMWQNLTSPTITIQVVDNPNKSGLNLSNKVLQINRLSIDTLSNDKSASGFAFRGAFATSYDLPMTATNCIIEAKILKTVTGKVGIRLYPNASVNTYTIVTTDVTGSPDWQTVQFNFSSLVLSMTATPKLNFEIEKAPTVAGQKDPMTLWVDDIKLLTSINPLNETFEATNVNIWKTINSTNILRGLVSNPVSDLINNSNTVLKVTKTGGAAAQAYDYVNTYAYPTVLNKTNNILQLKVLFRASENSGVLSTKIGIRLGADYNSDIQKTVNVSDNWQTIEYDYTTLTKYNNLFKQNKDTLSSVFTILPREDKLADGITPNLDPVVIYIDDIKVIAPAPASISDIKSDSSLSLYIIPRTSMLQIENLPEETCLFELTNLSGITCMKLQLNSTNDGIDVSSLNSGIYIASCYLRSGKMLVGKVIK